MTELGIRYGPNKRAKIMEKNLSGRTAATDGTNLQALMEFQLVLEHLTLH